VDFRVADHQGDWQGGYLHEAEPRVSYLNPWNESNNYRVLLEEFREVPFSFDYYYYWWVVVTSWTIAAVALVVSGDSHVPS